MINDKNSQSSRFLWLGRMILVRAVFAIIIAEIVMILWNLLLPSLIHVSAITYWQALGLLVLARLLTGRAGGSGYGGPMSHSRWRGRWGQLTDEEKEACRDKWRSKK